MLALTFDDGPDERWTRSTLQALERCDAKATFFMVGARLRSAPQVAHAVLDAGHEVQLHCHRHVRHTELAEGQIEADTRAALAAFARIGVRPTYWRTPWGLRSAATAGVAKRHGLRLVDWTIDTHDWRGDAPAAMLAHAEPRIESGSVVLMHDALGPGALRSGCENTIALIAPLITTARKRGLAVGPLSQQRPALDAPASQEAVLRKTARIGQRA